jgi:hypothetical protein
LIEQLTDDKNDFLPPGVPASPTGQKSLPGDSA